jgi:ABC-type transport system substrate-binding protein
VDGLIAQAKETADEDARRQLYYKAQEILLDDQPSLVMFNVVDLQVINKCVAGYNHDKSVRFNFLDTHLFSKEC